MFNVDYDRVFFHKLSNQTYCDRVIQGPHQNLDVKRTESLGTVDTQNTFSYYTRKTSLTHLFVPIFFNQNRMRLE